MGNGMNKVLPGLYVGNFRDSRDEKQLKDNKITHILSIHDNAKATRSDMVYLCLDAKDSASQDLTKYFSQCNDFIHSARMYGGHVLVHCLAGMSRSVTLTVAYIMSVTTLGWRDALNVVRVSRTCASPNFGFQKQLVAFQHEGVAQEKSRLLSKFPSATSLQASDRDECKVLLEKHERWVLEGDPTTPTILDEMTYPLPHNAYSKRRATSNAPRTDTKTSSRDGEETSRSSGGGPSQESQSSGPSQESRSDNLEDHVKSDDKSSKASGVESNNSSGFVCSEQISTGEIQGSETHPRTEQCDPDIKSSNIDQVCQSVEPGSSSESSTTRQDAIDNLFTQGRKDNSAKY